MPLVTTPPRSTSLNRTLGLRVFEYPLSIEASELLIRKMPDLFHKVKDALHGDHHHHSEGKHAPKPVDLSPRFPVLASLTALILPIDTDRPSTSSTDPLETNPDPVAQTSTISPTNPGILHSTKFGIHGARDSGAATTLATEGDDSRLTGTTRGAHAGKSTAPTNGGEDDGSVAHGNSLSATNPGVSDSTKVGIHGLRDSGTGVTLGFEETERKASELHNVGFVHGSISGASGEGSKESKEEEEVPYGTTTTITAGGRDNERGSGYDGSRRGSHGGEEERPLGNTTTVTAGGVENRVAGSGYEGRAVGRSNSRSETGSGLTSSGGTDYHENFAPGSGLSGR